MRLVRQGVCNKCGECCGRETPGGEAANPWMLIWGMRNWLFVDADAEIPHISLLGTSAGQNGEIVWQTTDVNGHHIGQIRIRNLRMDWVLDDNGLHKPDNLECPLLVDGEGGDKYACAAVGTQYEDRMYTGWCHEGPQELGFPRLEFADTPDRTAQQQYDDWFDSYPSCSFTYVEQP